MGFMDELKKLTRPYDDEDDIDDAEVLSEPEPPRANPFSGFGASPAPAREPVAASPVRQTRPKEGRVMSLGGAAGQQTQVVLIKPERFETAAEIADHLRSKRAVLVNLETTPKEVTRRLVDFLSGVTYAIDGGIKKVATNTYIIMPPNVNLVGDQMEELETSGIYF